MVILMQIPLALWSLSFTFVA